MPLTGYANKPDDIKDVIKMVGGAPLVVKLLQGTQGIGVVLAETQKAAESVIEGFMGVKADILVQEFIKEAGGSDIRCFVIDGKVVAAMKRQAPKGEFRSNLHRGGSSSLIKITPEERSTAVRAARIMGLNVAGVDLLRSNHGPVVMEVNSSPGLEGIDQVLSLASGGEQDDVHVVQPLVGPEETADLHPVDHRHHPVQHRQPRGSLRVELAPGFTAVGGANDLVAGALQMCFE